MFIDKLILEKWIKKMQPIEDKICSQLILGVHKIYIFFNFV